jgi:hypothetical protein
VNDPLRIKLIDLAGILGGVFLTYYGIGYVMTKIPLRLHAPDPLPPSGSGGGLALPSAPPKPQPRLMTEPVLRLKPGVRYGVSLDTPALAPISDNMVKNEAKSRGFTNIDVYSKPPAGWPGNTGKTKADTWVVALYEGPPVSMARSEGGVDVVEAFEG